MKSALVFVTFLGWALWFGGTIAVFVFGTDFFQSLPRPIAGEAAHAMFQVFAKYELILAGVCLLGSGLSLVLYPSKVAVILVGCLVLAGGMAVTVALGLMPLMESLRQQGLSGSDEWKKLHGKSMGAMAMQALVLLGTGWVISKAQESIRRLTVDAKVDADPAIEPSFRKRAGLSTRT
jgi:hypothetical protein